MFCKEKRFVIKEEQGLGFGTVYIVVDNETGVNYLTTIGTGINGMTSLVDSDSKVVIDR